MERKKKELTKRQQSEKDKTDKVLEIRKYIAAQPRC